MADAGYIIRTSNFYGNGQIGMRSFFADPAGHPLGAPYRKAIGHHAADFLMAEVVLFIRVCEGSELTPGKAERLWCPLTPGGPRNAHVRGYQ